jgi:hypothetical protein
MNNNFRQMPQQYMNNNFINGYQHHMNNNTPFQNNPILTTNPNFYGSIRDANFQNRANIAKLEQRKRVKTISDLGMTKDQILSYVIDPIKVIKQSAEELHTEYSKKADTYINPSDLTQITRADQSKLPKWLKEIYAGRKNTPYKSILKSANILKQEQYDKEFKDEAELLIHKVTAIDKDEIRFVKELMEKLAIFEEHNGELKLIYSTSKEAKHKKDFEYVQKYKHRSGYNPEDYTDLKKYYKKEQKRIDRENKRIDEMIEVLLINDQVTKEDLEQLQNTIEEDIDEKEVENMFKYGAKEIEKNLEKQIRKELGDEQFEEIMKQLVPQEEMENTQKNNFDEEVEGEEVEKVEEVEKQKRVRIKEKVIEKKPTKVKVKVRSTQEESEPEKQIGKIDNSDLEKYKNRKKKSI